MSIRTKIKRLVRRFGMGANSIGNPEVPTILDGIDERDSRILQAISSFTMTSVERQLAVIDAVRYLSCKKIVGSIVECGVWRGGCSMAAALTLLQHSDLDRDIYLYDTFEGMTAPTECDEAHNGTLARDEFVRHQQAGVNWCHAGLHDVEQNMRSTRFPESRLHFVQGAVEKTIPGKLPNSPIALLRLDTDWYESTKHELEHLFPLLAQGGVLIIDDYGYWKGAKKAVDEYFESQGFVFLMSRIDQTGRILIKS